MPLEFIASLSQIKHTQKAVQQYHDNYMQLKYKVKFSCLVIRRIMCCGDTNNETIKN